MHAPVKWLTRVGLVTAWAGAVGLAGCDVETPDTTVRSTVAEGQVLEAKGQTDRALPILNKAVTVADASPASKAHANAALAEAEMDLAAQQMSAVAQGQIQIDRLVNEIATLGAHISQINTRVAGYQATEPGEVRQDAEEKIAAAQGGPDQPVWFEYQGIRIPTLAAVRQEISQLEGDIAAKKENVAQLQEQRKTLLQRSAELEDQSIAARGQQSVDLFGQASDLRQQASEVAMQIEVVENQIDPLERQLVIAQNNQQIAEAAIQHYRDQIAHAETGWENVQVQIQQQANLAAEIVGRTGDAAPVDEQVEQDMGEAPLKTMSAKTSALVTQLAQTQENYDQAHQYLSDAIKHYQAAVQAADQFGRDLQSQRNELPPESENRKVIDLLTTTVSPSVYRQRQAEAQQALGMLLATQVVSLQSRVELAEALQPILQQAGLEVPEALTGADLQAQVAEIREAAEQAFVAAKDLYIQVGSGGGGARSAAAHLGRMFTLYGHSQMERLLGDTDQARALLADARLARDDALAQNATLPPLPPELRVARPATQPATQPANAGQGQAGQGQRPSAQGQPAQGAPAQGQPAQGQPAQAQPGQGQPAQGQGAPGQGPGAQGQGAPAQGQGNQARPPQGGQGGQNNQARPPQGNQGNAGQQPAQNRAPGGGRYQGGPLPGQGVPVRPPQ